jgi:fibronectin-binding autotransporter adhesin
MRTSSLLHLVLPCLIAALPLSAQVAVTLDDQQTNSTAYDTSSPNSPLTFGIVTGSATQSGILTGSGFVVKDGDGKLTLTATNTYTDGTVLNAGTLGLGADNALGTGTLTINGGTIRAEGAGRTLSNDVILNGDFTLGRYTHLSGAVTLSNDITITSANPDSSSRAHSTISGIISGAHAITFEEGANPIGEIVLAGANTYSGATTIQSGTVWIADTGSIASSESVNIAAGATLKVFGFEQTISNLSGAGSVVFGNYGSTLTIDSDADTTFSGSITGYASVTKTGSGTLTLTGASSYTGGTLINRGVLIISGGGSLSESLGFISNSTVIVTGAGSTWAHSDEISIGASSGIDSILTISDGGLVGASKVILGEYYGDNGTLNIGGTATGPATAGGVLDTDKITTGLDGTGTVQLNTTATADTPFNLTRDGTANGTGVLIKGNATVINTAGYNVLTAASTFSQGTIINGGTLAARGAFAGSSSLGTGPVTVNTGGTLAGNDFISGLTTVHTGGTLAPDAGGVLRFDGGLTFHDGAILTYSLGSQINALVVSGGVLTADGTITVNLFDSGDFTAGTYTLIDATGATLTSIGATSFELGTVIAGYTYSFAQDGSLFQLIATSTVPEPATAAALASLLALSFAAVRRTSRAMRPTA